MAERKTERLSHIAAVTECPICGDKMSNNRLLPCGHTFCLKCLEQYKQTTKSKRQSLQCHVCRKELNIPKGGFSTLPKNAIVEKILGIESKQDKDESDRPTVPEQCDLCAKGKKAIATVHCIECDQNFCDDCERTHSKLKTCFTHQIIPVSKTSQLGDYTSKTYCANHPDYLLELMCNDCNKPICYKCRSLTHASHTFANVEELAESYSEQLQSNIEEISQRLSTMAKLSEDIKDQEKQMQENFYIEKERVSQTAAELTRCILANEDKLIKQLLSSVKRNLQALQPYKLQVESHCNLLRKHKNSVEHLKESGHIWEILRSAGEFHKTAAELLSTDLITINKNKRALPCLTELQIQNHLIGTNSIYEDPTLPRLHHGFPSPASPAEIAEKPLEDSSDRYKRTSTDEHKKSFQAEVEMTTRNGVKKKPVALTKKAQLQAGCQKHNDTDVMRQQPTTIDTISSTACPSEICTNDHLQSQREQGCDENQYETLRELNANSYWNSSSSPIKGSSRSPLLGTSSAMRNPESREWLLAESNDRTAFPINTTKKGFHEELEMAMKNRIKKKPATLPKKTQF